MNQAETTESVVNKSVVNKSVPNDSVPDNTEVCKGELYGAG
ncbi:hypothetical protein [Veillonella sp.]|nr:hypothetical protein [Veillonella sp.]